MKCIMKVMSRWTVSCCLSCFFFKLPTCRQRSWFSSFNWSKSRWVCFCCSDNSWSNFANWSLSIDDWTWIILLFQQNIMVSWTPPPEEYDLKLTFGVGVICRLVSFLFIRPIKSGWSFMKKSFANSIWSVSIVFNVPSCNFGT